MCGTFCSLCLVYRNAEDLNKSGILCCLASMFVPCIPLMLLRGEAREKYGIEVRIFIILASGPPLAAHVCPSGLKRQSRREEFSKFFLIFKKFEYLYFSSHPWVMGSP